MSAVLFNFSSFEMQPPTPLQKIPKLFLFQFWKKKESFSHFLGTSASGLIPNCWQRSPISPISCIGIGFRFKDWKWNQITFLQRQINQYARPRCSCRLISYFNFLFHKHPTDWQICGLHIGKMAACWENVLNPHSTHTCSGYKIEKMSGDCMGCWCHNTVQSNKNAGQIMRTQTPKIQSLSPALATLTLHYFTTCVST